MTNYRKCVLTGACLVAAYAVLLGAFRLLNAPNDTSLYSGLAVVLGLLAILPAALQAIWRRRT
jgi:hypothetical protein